MRPIHKRIRAHVARCRRVRKCAVCIQRQRAMRDIRDERSRERVVFHIRIVCEHARIHGLREADTAVHTDVAAVHSPLVNFHRNRIGPFNQQTGGNRQAPSRRRFKVLRRKNIVGRVRDDSGSDENLRAIDIHNARVIMLQGNFHVRGLVKIRHRKRSPEIRSNVFSKWIRPEADHRHLIAVSVAKFRRTRRPRCVIKAHRPPSRSLVRSVVQVLPARR